MSSIIVVQPTFLMAIISVMSRADVPRSISLSSYLRHPSFRVSALITIPYLPQRSLSEELVIIWELINRSNIDIIV